MRRQPQLVLSAAVLMAPLCSSMMLRETQTRTAVAPQQQSAAGTFLGFTPGEEVRYRLENGDGEQGKARITWSIRLEDIDGDTGVFALEYEVGGIAGSERGQGPAPMGYTTARAWISAYGFPKRVRLTTRRRSPMGDLEYTVEYRYEDRRFIKELEGNDERQSAKLEGYRVIDLEIPSGVYLFMPVEPECVAAAGQLAVRGRSNRGGGSSPGGRRSGRGAPGLAEQPCRGREPVFANPGLLSLTMPALWEAGTGQLELLAIAPTGINNAAMGGGRGGGRGGSGVSIGGFNVLGGGGPDPFGDADDAFQMFALAAESEPLQIEVGGRPVDVWRLNASAPLEAAYVDGNGSIVRLDLPVDPETGERYRIRRLRPSEY